MIEEVCEENEEERVSKLEIKNKYLHRERKKLKNALNDIKKDLKIEKDNLEDELKIKKRQELKRERKFLMNTLKQFERIIIENKISSASDVSSLSYDDSVINIFNIR